MIFTLIKRRLLIIGFTIIIQTQAIVISTVFIIPL